MSAETLTPRFKGDIAAQDELSTHNKGGSITATLKKGVASALGLGARGEAKPQALSAAAVEIDSGNHILLMAVQEALGKSIQVRRTGEHSVEIFINNGESEEVSEIAASFAEFKKKLFAQGRLNLTAPMDAQAFEALADRALADARARHQTS